MQKTSNTAETGDAFTNELRQKKYETGEKLAAKKRELSQLDGEQRRLKALIDSEKQSGAGGKQKKGKQQNQAKEVRLDIVRNEQKFKEQAKKLDEIRKEVQHLESDLKSLAHDLSVVEQSH